MCFLQTEFEKYISYITKNWGVLQGKIYKYTTMYNKDDFRALCEYIWYASFFVSQKVGERI